MSDSWIERKSRRAERLARGKAGRRAASVAESLDLTARSRRIGWTDTARALIECARVRRMAS